MANFQTHLSVGVMTSAAYAAWGVYLDNYGTIMALILTAVGTFGSLLPDIDLDQSPLARLLFVCMAVILASLAASAGFYHLSKQALWYAAILWIAVFLAIRYVAYYLFHHWTVHRGMVHSIPYMALLALFTVCICFYGLSLSAQHSWLIGLFLGFGALVHLLLDELSGVNLLNLRIKRSFGTALKIFERKKALNYAYLYLLILGIYPITPPMNLTLRLIGIHMI